MDSIDPKTASGPERRDNWYVIRGIPVAVLLGLAVHGASFAWYLSGLNAQVQQQSKEQAADRAEWRAGLARVESKVETLTATVQNGSVPAALNQRRIEDLERAMGRIESRIGENERKFATEAVRNRAARDR